MRGPHLVTAYKLSGLSGYRYIVSLASQIRAAPRNLAVDVKKYMCEVKMHRCAFADLELVMVDQLTGLVVQQR